MCVEEIWYILKDNIAMSPTTRYVVRGAGMLAATTIGAGMFGLPFVFSESGWLTGLGYLLILGFVMGWVHLLYIKTLARAGKKMHILSFVKEGMPRRFFWLSVFVIVGGLVFALVVYLVLGMEFVRILFPYIGPKIALFGFWIIGTAPIAFTARRITLLEFFGTILLAIIVFAVFVVGAKNMDALFDWAAFVPSRIFLPFGVILFSLAGWTALEPIYELWRNSPKRFYSLPLWMGTALVVFLYLLFVLGIARSGAAITPDTLTGFIVAAPVMARLLALLGLFALWTSYVPVGLEIKNVLLSDMKWKYATSFVAIAPLVLVLAGVDTFVGAIGVAGGVFVSLQYVLILLVVERGGLAQSSVKRIAIKIAATLFLIVAAHEFFVFFW